MTQSDSANGHIAQDFISRFQSRYGRSPRILHIGNIANNAYLNAKYLNEAGFDCDVICYDYYHIMGCPEWEDARFEARGLDHFQPNWTAVDLGGFERPKWFAQGPQKICIDYLIAKRRNQGKKQAALWEELSWANKTVKRTRCLPSESVLYRLFLRHKLRVSTIFNMVVRRHDALSAVFRKLRKIAKQRDILSALAINIATPIILTGVAFVRLTGKGALKIYEQFSPEQEIYQFDDAVERRVSAFTKKFMARADKMVADDFSPYAGAINDWKRLFEHYDLVLGYATDGVYPMLAEMPYIAYEHGTIRNIPFENSAQGRICAAVYAFAEQVFITNCDNMNAARKLDLRQYSFIPHPVNEAMREPSVVASPSVKKNINNVVEFLVFHPARHSWSSERHPDWEKGNDLIIQGFAEFVSRVDVSTFPRLLLVEWGGAVNESKALIKALGIENHIEWIDPLPHQALVEHIRHADAVIDQISVGAFGSLLAKSLMCGKPSLCWIEESVHKECFPEMPPIVNVKNASDVAQALLTLSQDHAYRESVAVESRNWYAKYHSKEVVVDRAAGAFADILSN